MRYILLLLLFSTSFCFGQSDDDEKIIVLAADTADLFNRVAASLTEKGYSIEIKDEQTKSIATSEKKLKRLNASMKVHVMIKDATCIVSGSYALDFHFKIGSDKEDRIFNPIEYHRIQGIAPRECWNELEEIAKSIGSQMQYSR
jgi:hypothetical protein